MKSLASLSLSVLLMALTVSHLLACSPREGSSNSVNAANQTSGLDSVTSVSDSSKQKLIPGRPYVRESDILSQIEMVSRAPQHRCFHLETKDGLACEFNILTHSQGVRFEVAGNQLMLELKFELQPDRYRSLAFHKFDRPQIQFFVVDLKPVGNPSIRVFVVYTKNEGVMNPEGVILLGKSGTSEASKSMVVVRDPELSATIIRLGEKIRKEITQARKK